MDSKKIKTIFLCSTVHDGLGDTRAILRRALTKADYTVYDSLDNKSFPVKTGVDSYTACIEAVKKSDLLILIINTRYGGIVPKGILPDKDISITEWEYDTAIENGILRINFCSNEAWNKLCEWKKGPEKTFFPDPPWDDGPRLMGFIDRIKKAHEKGKVNTDNWIHPYNNGTEIIDTLEKRLNINENKQLDIRQKKNSLSNLDFKIESINMYSDKFPDGDPFDAVPTGTVDGTTYKIRILVSNNRNRKEEIKEVKVEIENNNQNEDCFIKHFDDIPIPARGKAKIGIEAYLPEHSASHDIVKVKVITIDDKVIEKKKLVYDLDR